MRVVGKPLPKVDAAAKVTGRALYADDIALPRTLHCKILRSPHPHARILSIDTSAAKRIPGVLAVITGLDLPIKFGILPVTQDERALEHEKVRYVGDPIAAGPGDRKGKAPAPCGAPQGGNKGGEPLGVDGGAPPTPENQPNTEH